eukprot:727422_1
MEELARRPLMEEYDPQLTIQKSNETNLNLSRSALMTPDMSHHILHHGLQPLMCGTPHHGEAHLVHKGDSPIRGVVMNMLNSMIGAGVVGLPFVFSTAGLFGGLFLMISFSLITAYSLKLLIISAKLCQQKNYEDLCEYLFGLKGYILVSVTMFIFDFGAILSYLIILGDAGSDIISIWGYDSRLDRRLLVAVISTFIILPTVLPRDISKIEKISALSVFSAILIMLIVIYEWIAYRFLMLERDEGYTSHLPKDINWGVDMQGFPMALGIIAFAFVCHDCAFLCYNTLKNPTVRRWTILSYVGCLAAVLICACFAVPGYLTFGGKVEDNILQNYDTMNSVIIAARGIYCITLALTYPCSFFVVRHVCYAMFHHGPGYTSIVDAPLSKHLLFTLPLFAVNVVMGIFIENLGIVMSVSGSLGAVILAFVLPPMCYLRICQFSVLFWTEKGWHRKWRAFKTRSRLSEFMHSKLDRDLIYSSEMHGLRPNMCHDKAISNIGYKIDKNKANIDIQKYINLVHNGPLVSFGILQNMFVIIHLLVSNWTKSRQMHGLPRRIMETIIWCFGLILHYLPVYLAKLLLKTDKNHHVTTVTFTEVDSYNQWTIHSMMTLDHQTQG